MIKAKIKNISLVPISTEQGIFYTAEIELNDSVLTTNYNKSIPFSQNMIGTAEIITDDVRLLERFLNPLRSIWRESVQWNIIIFANDVKRNKKFNITYYKIRKFLICLKSPAANSSLAQLRIQSVFVRSELLIKFGAGLTVQCFKIRNMCQAASRYASC